MCSAFFRSEIYRISVVTFILVQLPPPIWALMSIFQKEIPIDKSVWSEGSAMVLAE